MKTVAVKFSTGDATLKKQYDGAEAICRENIKDFDGKQVLTEGAGYAGMWPETQPMGGEMYAKRNMEIALNNQTVFFDYQRRDGRFPGMLHLSTTADVENQPVDLVVEPIGVTASYGWLQGFCFPQHALNMYYHAELGKEYLQRMYVSFSQYDEYLWRYRDSDGDGCLELWCEWDTGEDNAYRMRGLPHGWGKPYPPAGRGCAPIESMDMMAYSYVARDTLSKISALLDNGRQDYWAGKASQVAEKVRRYLWIEEKDACYDRDQNNEFIDILLHNNLRLMYYGVFSQDMADRFVKAHLKNPDEFWTNMPLPSVAANDSAYRGMPGNNWSGHPQGLTYQRAIIALERYGYVQELTTLFKKFSKAIGSQCAFNQQYDTVTMEPSGPEENTYGPSAIAFLEYVSRLYGVHITPDSVWWGVIESPYDSDYTQIWGDDTYRIVKKGTEATAFLNEKKLFSFCPGFRIVSDAGGKPLRAVRIEEGEAPLVFNGRVLARLKANQIFAFEEKEVNGL